MARKARNAQPAPPPKPHPSPRPPPTRHRPRQDHRRLHGAARRKALRARSASATSPARAGVSLAHAARRVRLDARDPRRAHEGPRPRGARPADADMAEEPPRERLFDVLMRRIEAMAPYREAMRSLLRSALRNPPLAFALNGLGGALAAMDADRRRHRRRRPARHDPRAGARDAVRARCCAPGSMTRIPGLARTMAALDRALARGQRLSGMLDDLCFIPSRLCRLRGRRRRTQRRRRRGGG